jgi:hypothetical protein
MKSNLNSAFLFVLLIIATLNLTAQKTETDNKTLWFGIEPFMLLMGEKGGFIGYSANDKLGFQLYAAHYGWWWSKGDVRQMKWHYLSDYIFAAKGPVIRLSAEYLLSDNPMKISKALFRPEITYKYLSYENTCFHEGSGGSSYDLFQLRSMRSHVAGIHAEFVYKHCDSSEWDLPLEWFIGPGILMIFEQKHLLGENYGICPVAEFDEKTVSTLIYPSLRFGLRIGLKIFESGNN